MWTTGSGGRGPGAVAFVTSGLFSERELRAYLLRRSRDWGGVPPDVREHLKYPLLAGLYCELNPEPVGHPRTEYEVFARVGDVLRDHRLQADHPDDRRAVLELAAGLFEPHAEYPWPVRRCREAGLDSAEVTRLERTGWLARVDGGVAVRHDRLRSPPAAGPRERGPGRISRRPEAGGVRDGERPR